MAVQQPKSANMKDVAALAGVSIATISRYLNGETNRMSKVTAVKVAAAIEKLNYVPNSSARQMITKSSKMIAVITANIDDYFSSELFKGISSILESQGYIGVLFDADSDNAREQKLLEVIGRQVFDGLIIQPANDPQMIQQALRRQLPVVVVDREMDAGTWPQVVTDNYQIARQATQHFLDEGCTHVIVLTSDVHLARTRQERYRGILSVADNVDTIEVSEASYNHSAVYQQLKAALTRSTERTLVFALKERWFLEFIPDLINEGLLDGRRVTATGFADTDIARRLAPNTQLITQNPYLMGASAAELLLQELQDPKLDLSHQKLIQPAKFG